MYKSIYSDDFYQLTQTASLAILDVREVDEFEDGHIASSENLPLSSLVLDYEKLDKSQPYFVICHAGVRSANACDFLSQEGYDVTNVMGGMSAWEGDVV